MKVKWTIKKISDVAKTSSGGTPLKSKKEYYTNGRIPWILSGEVGQGEVSEAKNYITESGLNNSSAKMFPENTVLVAMYGATAAQCGLLKFSAATNQAVCGIFPNDDLTPQFTFYFFLHHKRELLSQAVGNAQPNISQAKIRNTQIPIPPLSEQEDIVEVLDKAFAAIDQAKANLEQNIANAKELFQSKLNQIFSQKSEGWVEAKLGDESLLKIIDGDRGKNYPKKSDFMEAGHCLFLNTGNVRPDGFKFDKLMFISEERDNLLRKGKLERNDIVMTTRGTIGNLGWYDSAVPYDHIRINSGMLVFRPDQTKLLSEYLFTLFRSSVVTRQIEEKTSGAAQPQLPIKTLVNFVIPFCLDLDEQKSMVVKIEELERIQTSILSRYQTKLASLDELKKSILQKAFAGELT